MGSSTVGEPNTKVGRETLGVGIVQRDLMTMVIAVGRRFEVERRVEEEGAMCSRSGCRLEL